MRNVAIIGVLLLTGCTASLQPFPSVTRGEFNAALVQISENERALGEAINKLTIAKNASEGLAKMAEAAAESKEEEDK